MTEESKEALKRIKEALNNGEHTSLSDWTTAMGGTPLGLAFPKEEKAVHNEEQSEGKSGDEKPDIENMEFRYGRISDERCAEINSWRIPDPYGYGKKYNASGDFLVTNEDETILFCWAFIPRTDDVDRFKPAYVFIYGNEYQYIYFDVIECHDELRSEKKYRVQTIKILGDKFIDECQDKILLLRIIKSLIKKYIESSRLSRKPQPIYEFTFYYNGEEI